MNVAVREYDFVDSEIRFTYHYGEEEYTQTIKRFFKPARADRSNKNPSLPDVLENYEVNKYLLQIVIDCNRN